MLHLETGSGGLLEHRLLQEILPELDGVAEVAEIGDIRHEGASFPIHSLCVGSKDPQAPLLLLTGGVHGLERIGSHVILAFFQHLARMARWSTSIQNMLGQIRIAALPVINPVGMSLRRRSNGHGVDLMRNAPVESNAASWRLWSGQRLSSQLPWFRGQPEAMEKESQLLCDYVRSQRQGRRFTLALDLHSGFGSRDSLWYPYSHRLTPPANLAEYAALARLLDKSPLQSIYDFEPQTRHYQISGDLWDLLLLEAENSGDDKRFLPLTLELGSWLWLRKHPSSILSSEGPFNPLIRHRYERILRRHGVLLLLLAEACASHAQWLPKEAQRPTYHSEARNRWYGK